MGGRMREHLRARSKTDCLVLLLLSGYFFFQLFFGVVFHPIEASHTAEDDGYVLMADTILRGELPKDGFHPLFYPLIVAGMTAVTGDSFAAARTVSTLATLLLLCLSYRIGKRCLNPRAGAFVVIALILNATILTEGVYASSDMTFAALATLVLDLCLGFAGQPGFRQAVLLALAFSLAYFTKNQALALLPLVLVAMAAPGDPGKKEKIRNIGVFFGSALVFLLPNFILTACAFGNPFYNENWKNFAFKLFGHGDWSYFDRIPYDGWLAVLRDSSLSLILQSTWAMLRYFCTDTLPILMGGAGIGVLFALLGGAGLLFMAFRLTVGRALVLVSFLSQALFLCLLFGPAPRLLIALIPIGYLLAGAILFDWPPARIPAGRRPQLPHLLALGLFVWLFLGSCRQAQWFIQNHPYGELRDTQELERRFGPRIVVYGTSPFMKRHVRIDYRYLYEAFGDEAKDPARYYAKICRVLSENSADFVVIGKTSLRNRPAELLRNDRVPACLRLYKMDEETAVYRVVR